LGSVLLGGAAAGDECHVHLSLYRRFPGVDCFNGNMP